MRKRREIESRLREMCGNVRVFCRVRPVLPMEDMLAEGRGAVSVYVSGDSASDDGIGGEMGAPGQVLVRRESTSSLEQAFSAGVDSLQRFEFDRVYGPTAEQSQISADVLPHVKDVLRGVHLCVFAYGQTGTGKTYTMEGRDGEEGLVYQGLHELFRQLALVRRGRTGKTPPSTPERPSSSE